MLRVNQLTNFIAIVCTGASLGDFGFGRTIDLIQDGVEDECCV